MLHSVAGQGVGFVQANGWPGEQLVWCGGRWSGHQALEHNSPHGVLNRHIHGLFIGADGDGRFTAAGAIERHFRSAIGHRIGQLGECGLDVDCGSTAAQTIDRDIEVITTTGKRRPRNGSSGRSESMAGWHQFSGSKSWMAVLLLIKKNW